MRGLMYGNKILAQDPRPISLSLMAVIQNALSYAWRILLIEVANGRFSICNQDEDVITEQLYMILCELYTSEQEVIEGFSQFETPVREGNMRNLEGTKLDNQPDLTFRPLKGIIPTINSAPTAIFVECKPIDSRHPVSGTYCKKGISRFISNNYAWAVDRAIMLAYVRNTCPLPEGLAYVLDDSAAKEDYKIQGSLSPLGKTASGDAVYYTVHGREKSTTPARIENARISLHHLWLFPDRPCENTSCKVKAQARQPDIAETFA
ncbi:hypothetical protein [Microbulbifer litoralis]|uniref:hypothetical protein n=1 Tax=Microbulbifer litoralis TaxID=2933965 RepID=UPI0020277260|nr:hypothetical protein [Microbulbifer sp. GX H0434]